MTRTKIVNPPDYRNKAAAKHFEDTAGSWTDRYVENHGLSHSFLIRRRAVEWQLSSLPKREHERALDLGCGTGPYLGILSKMATEVVGIDIAPAMIEEAKRNLNPALNNVTLKVASLFDLPFPDSHFDVGVCVGVLEYFDDPVAILRAAFRVVKPGGMIVFTVPHTLGISRMTGIPRTLTLLAPPKWKIVVGSLLNRMRGREPDPSKYHLGISFTRSRIRKLCAQAGLEVHELTMSGYEPLRLAGLPVPAGIRNAVDRIGEASRFAFPWKNFGNDLIVTIRKPQR